MSNIKNFPLSDKKLDAAISHAVSDGILVIEDSLISCDFKKLSPSLIKEKLTPRVMRWLQRQGNSFGQRITLTEGVDPLEILLFMQQKGVWNGPIEMIVDLYLE